MDAVGVGEARLQCADPVPAYVLGRRSALPQATLRLGRWPGGMIDEAVHQAPQKQIRCITVFRSHVSHPSSFREALHPTQVLPPGWVDIILTEKTRVPPSTAILFR